MSTRPSGIEDHQNTLYQSLAERLQQLRGGRNRRFGPQGMNTPTNSAQRMQDRVQISAQALGVILQSLQNNLRYSNQQDYLQAFRSASEMASGSTADLTIPPPTDPGLTPTPLPWSPSATPVAPIGGPPAGQTPAGAPAERPNVPIPDLKPVPPFGSDSSRPTPEVETPEPEIDTPEPEAEPPAPETGRGSSWRDALGRVRDAIERARDAIQDAIERGRGADEPAAGETERGEETAPASEAGQGSSWRDALGRARDAIQDAIERGRGADELAAGETERGEETAPAPEAGQGSSWRDALGRARDAIQDAIERGRGADEPAAGETEPGVETAPAPAPPATDTPAPEAGQGGSWRDALGRARDAIERAMDTVQDAIERGRGADEPAAGETEPGVETAPAPAPPATEPPAPETPSPQTPRIPQTFDRIGDLDIQNARAFYDNEGALRGVSGMVQIGDRQLRADFVFRPGEDGQSELSRAYFRPSGAFDALANGLNRAFADGVDVGERALNQASRIAEQSPEAMGRYANVLARSGEARSTFVGLMDELSAEDQSAFLAVAAGAGSRQVDFINQAASLSGEDRSNFLQAAQNAGNRLGEFLDVTASLNGEQQSAFLAAAAGMGERTGDFVDAVQNVSADRQGTLIDVMGRLDEGQQNQMLDSLSAISHSPVLQNLFIDTAARLDDANLDRFMTAAGNLQGNTRGMQNFTLQASYFTQRSGDWGDQYIRAAEAAGGRLNEMVDLLNSNPNMAESARRDLFSLTQRFDGDSQANLFAAARNAGANVGSYLNQLQADIQQVERIGDQTDLSIDASGRLQGTFQAPGVDSMTATFSRDNSGNLIATGDLVLGGETFSNARLAFDADDRLISATGSARLTAPGVTVQMDENDPNSRVNLREISLNFNLGVGEDGDVTARANSRLGSSRYGDFRIGFELSQDGFSYDYTRIQ